MKTSNFNSIVFSILTILTVSGQAQERFCRLAEEARSTAERCERDLDQSVNDISQLSTRIANLSVENNDATGRAQKEQNCKNSIERAKSKTAGNLEQITQLNASLKQLEDEEKELKSFMEQNVVAWECAGTDHQKGSASDTEVVFRASVRDYGSSEAALVGAQRAMAARWRNGVVGDFCYPVARK